MNHKSAAILLLHFIERALFFLIIPVVPYLLWKEGGLSTGDLAAFYMVSFFFYRGTPILLGFICDRIGFKIAVVIGVFLEGAGLLGVLYSTTSYYLFLFGFISGIGGGIVAPSVITVLSNSTSKSGGGGLNLFSWHFMLINLAALCFPIISTTLGSYQIGFVTSVAIIFVTYASILISQLPNQSKSDINSDYNYLAMMKETIRNAQFLRLWVTTTLVWACCSVVYSVVPSKDIEFFGSDKVNVWLTIDTIAVIISFFIFKYFKLFSGTSVNNATFGTLLAAGGLILISIATTPVVLAVAVTLLGVGGLVAFPQLYNLVSENTPMNSKAHYMGLLTVGGAIGEGGVQAAFTLIKDPSIISMCVASLLIISTYSLFQNVNSSKNEVLFKK